MKVKDFAPVVALNTYGSTLEDLFGVILDRAREKKKRSRRRRKEWKKKRGRKKTRQRNGLNQIVKAGIE